jgi:hypothetical protein
MRPMRLGIGFVACMLVLLVDLALAQQAGMHFHARMDFKGLDEATQPDPSMPGFNDPELFLTTSVAVEDFDGDGVTDVALALEGRDVITLYRLSLITQDYVRYRTITLTSGDRPTSIVAARINNDAFVDLAVANYGVFDPNNPSNSTVKLFRGDGNGNFTAMGSPLTAGVHPFHLIAADFNLDGRMDLAVANAGDPSGFGGSVTTFIQTFVSPNGVPFFNSQSFPMSPAALDRAEGLAAADFNGDAYLDIAIAGGGASGPGISFLIWRQSPSPPRFVAATTSGGAAFVLNPGGPKPMSLVGVNLPGHPFTSLAVANFGDPTLPDGNVVIFQNATPTNAPGQTNNLAFDPVQTIDYRTGVPLNDTHAKNPRYLAYRPVDNEDDLADLVVLNNGSANVTILQKDPAPLSPAFVLLQAPPSGSLNPLYTGSRPTCLVFPPAPPSTRPSFFVANRESNAFSMFRGLQSTVDVPFMAAGNVRVDRARPRTAELVDIYPASPGIDLVVSSPDDGNSNPGYIWFLRNDGMGQFTRQFTYQMTTAGFPANGPFRKPWTVKVGELEQLPGDPQNAIEVVTANTTTLDISILSFDPAVDPNTASPVLRETTIGVGNNNTSTEMFSPKSVALADFDADGDLDIASTGFHWDNSIGQETNANSFVRLVFNDMAGPTQSYLPPTTSYPVGPRPNDVIAPDLDGDGSPDLVVVNCGAISGGTADPGSITMLLNQGGGSFVVMGTHSVGSQGGVPRRAAAADLNADSKVDIVVANERTDNITIFFGDGMGGVMSQTWITVGISPIDVDIGDLNVDGILDLAVVDRKGYDVAILLGIGDGTFQPPRFFGAGDDAYHVVIGNVDADPKPDIVVPNKTEGKDLSVLLNRM